MKQNRNIQNNLMNWQKKKKLGDKGNTSLIIPLQYKIDKMNGNNYKGLLLLNISYSIKARTTELIKENILNIWYRRKNVEIGEIKYRVL